MREELIKELEEKFRLSRNIAEWDLSEEFDYFGGLADFIISDRKKVVEPLVKFNTQEPVGQRKWRIGMIYAIDQTLKNAGIEQ